MNHPKKRSVKNDRLLSRISIFFIFLLYLSGTVLMLKGAYDFFTYPELDRLSCNLDGALNRNDLKIIYDYAKYFADNAVYNHMKQYHNSSSREVPPVIPPQKEIMLCFTPIATMAKGILMILLGIVLQFAAIMLIVSIRTHTGLQITKKKRI